MFRNQRAPKLINSASSLTQLEKRVLARLFDMHTSYVLRFSNRNPLGVLLDTVGIDKYEAKCSYASGSNASRSRVLWSEGFGSCRCEGHERDGGTRRIGSQAGSGVSPDNVRNRRFPPWLVLRGGSPTDSPNVDDHDCEKGSSDSARIHYRRLTPRRRGSAPHVGVEIYVGQLASRERIDGT